MTVYPHLPFSHFSDFLANISKKRFNLRITTNRFTFFAMLAEVNE